VGGGIIPLPAGKDEKLSREFEGGALISAEGAVPSLLAATPAGGDMSSLEWDTYPPAGKGSKLPWECGGEASAISARCAAALSSLDSLENNRHKRRTIADFYVRPVGRGRFCGRYSLGGVDPKTGKKVYRRLNCGSWGCSYCGPRKARSARAAICRHAEALNLCYFLTLTIDMKKVEFQDKKFAVPHLRRTFNKFREYLRRKYGVPLTYISVLEFTQAGVPHLHILLDRYIPQAWISEVWSSLGGGRIVFIKRVTIQKVARYLSKYLTKELLLSAPKGSRRISTSRSVKLFPKFDSGIAWELLKASIYRLLYERKMTDFKMQKDFWNFISIEFDEEHFLKSFQVHTDGVREGFVIV
jgi:hypothetical protein